MATAHATPQVNPAKLIDLIDVIYAAGARRGDWGEVLAALDDLVPDTWLVLQGLNGPQGAISIPYIRNWDHAAAKDYIENHLSHSPWVPLHENAVIGRPYNTSSTAAVERIRETAFFQDWALPHRVHCGATALTALKTPDTIASLCINYDHRRADQLDPFFEQLFLRIGAHLTSALELQHELAVANRKIDSLAALLEDQSDPTILADRKGRVIALSAGAEGLVKSGGELFIDHGSALTFTRPEQAQAFRGFCYKALRDLGFAAQPSLHLPVTLGGRRYIARARLVIAPLTGAQESLFFSPASAIVVTLIDLSRGLTLDEAALIRVFKLTPGEGRVAAGIAAGKSPQEIAAAQGTSVNTVRSHLRAVFAKTGSHSQGQLVLLLAKFAI